MVDERIIPSEDISIAYGNLRSGLLRFLRARVESAETAEDLLQTIFVKVLASGQAPKSSDTMAAWFYKIARNTLIDHYRARRPSVELPDDLAVEEALDTASQQALSACLLPLTHQLPPLYRDVLLATEFQGQRLASIAAALNVSVSAVKSRASRGRRLLRDKLLHCCHVELSPAKAVTDHYLRAQAVHVPSCACPPPSD